MAAHAPWSREEVSLLLRAWADAVESRSSREVGHAAFLRYEALYCASACGGHGSVSSRAEASVFNKRNSLENMHTVISLFLTSISVMSGQNKEEEEEEECSYLRSSDKLRVWFGMPETKRRR